MSNVQTVISLGLKVMLSAVIFDLTSIRALALNLNYLIIADPT